MPRRRWFVSGDRNLATALWCLLLCIGTGCGGKGQLDIRVKKESRVTVVQVPCPEENPGCNGGPSQSVPGVLAPGSGGPEKSATSVRRVLKATDFEIRVLVLLTTAPVRPGTATLVCDVKIVNPDLSSEHFGWTYQWSKGGTVLPGETQATLVIPQPDLRASAYSCRANPDPATLQRLGFEVEPGAAFVGLEAPAEQGGSEGEVGEASGSAAPGTGGSSSSTSEGVGAPVLARNTISSDGFRAIGQPGLSTWVILQSGGLEPNIRFSEENEPLVTVVLEPMASEGAGGTLTAFECPRPDVCLARFAPSEGFVGTAVYRYKVVASDSEQSDWALVELVYPPLLSPGLEIPSEGVTVDVGGAPLSLVLQPRDIAGPNFTCVECPPGVTLGEASGLLAWDPQKDQAGIHLIRVHVTSSNGLIQKYPHASD